MCQCDTYLSCWVRRNGNAKVSFRSVVANRQIFGFDYCFCLPTSVAIFHMVFCFAFTIYINLKVKKIKKLIKRKPWLWKKDKIYIRMKIILYME